MEGISFLVRVHDEEATLERSISSLFTLLISYEVLLLLNACTDNSAAIAARLHSAHPHRIRIFEYNHTLSRPGYETLATDADSAHSMAHFMNWGLRLARYKWVAKWDADFVMSPPLRDRINAEGRTGRWARGDQVIRMGARSHDGSVEYGDYFSSCIDHFRKDIFWENTAFRIGPGHIRFQWSHPHEFIEHVSWTRQLKPYWNRPGWYATEEGAHTEEGAAVRSRLLALERDFGMAPTGLGRSGTTDDATALAERIRAAAPVYVRLWA
jgi:glycosyltransferase involved in cell wall biosynthesis